MRITNVRVISSVFLLLASLCSNAAVASTGNKATSEVINHYADIALVTYSDALYEARELLVSVEELVELASDETLSEAKKAWLKARVPYQQSEVFRFGNAIVDDWEGKVNAWPLDEGLIDYVDGSYGNETQDNPLRNLNIIAKKTIQFSGKTINASVITKELIASTLHEADGVEANVATGYHAIEFLLWGQDLNGTGPGAGNRPATDFDLKNCTNGNCDRRAQYLLVATQLLVEDLAWIVEQWAENGAARNALLINQQEALNSIITGLGSLSYGELAGERIKLGLVLHDPEEEHDCFSDNTHNSHFYNIKGMQNVYLGEYTSSSGKLISGASLSGLVAEQDKKLDEALRKNLTNSLKKAQVLIESAEQGVAYDQLIADGNTKGNFKVSELVDALLSQTISIKGISPALGLSNTEFEGSDSLDSPNAVFQ